MSHTRLRPSFSFTDDQLAALKQIVPEAFADGQINWDTLKEALGEHLDDEGADAEHFGLNWPGKREARRMAGSPSKGTLLPQPGKGVNEESTRNVFIEGENLEVLKLLQKAYAGRVKMIYIDPPYNTGNDFVYEDDFTEPLEEYLRRTGQVDEEGRALTTNTRADGRFHSKWLSMMYPRLRLARQLLRDDGVIFVSIDDNEVHHMKNLLAEVFGEENFIGQWNWFKSATPPNLSKKIKKNVEYVLAYEKVRSGTEYKGIRKFSPSDDPLTKPQNAIKPLTFPAGVLEIGLDDQDIKPGIYGTDKYPFELVNKLRVRDGRNADDVTFKTKFTWTQPKLDMEIELGTKLKIASDKLVISYKKADYGEEIPPNLIDWTVGVGTTEQAGKRLKDLMDGYKVFDYPKPTELITYLANFLVEDGDIIVDFFAGSGSTGHAVMELNKEGKPNCQFLLVQLPVLLDKEEAADKEAFEFCKKHKLNPTIAEVCAERLRRSIPDSKFETGFLSFGLGKSHYRAWRDVEGADLTALEKAFAEAESPLVQDGSPEGLCTEVMLLEGFPLDSRVEKVAALKKNEVHRIHHEWHAHALLVCLEKKVHADTIKDLQLADGDIFICLDTAIDDQSKLRLSDKGMIKTI